MSSVEAEVAHLVTHCRRYRVALTCADITADRFAPDVTRARALGRVVAALTALARTPPIYDTASTRGEPVMRAS